MQTLKYLGRGLLRSPSRPLFLAYWIALTTGTHWPRLAIPGLYSDKVLHLGAFGGLALLLGWAYPQRWGSKLGRLGILALTLIVYATIDEITQLKVPGRTACWEDWFADLAGITLGLACHTAWMHCHGWRLLDRLRSFGLSRPSASNVSP